MKKLLAGLLCLVKGHSVEVGASCPVTGVKLIVCKNCGKDNMPKHSKGMSFN